MSKMTERLRNDWVIPMMIVVMLVVSVAVYPSLPELVPTQWSFTGEVSSYMPRWMAVIFVPSLTAGLWLMRMVLPQIDPRRESYEQFADSYIRIWQAVALLLLIMHVLMLTQYENPTALIKGILFGVALLLAVMGNEMGRFRQTFFVGIRTPWTLDDERVWRITHRTGARWLTGIGILNMIAVPLLPFTLAIVVLVGTTLLTLGGLAVYSYLVHRRLN